MRSAFDYPEYWRERAEETRALAASVTDDRTRRILIGIAVDYEFLAEQAEQRARLDRHHSPQQR